MADSTVASRDTPFVDRLRLSWLADALAAAVAASLPWSTSATTVLIVAWFIVLVPTLDTAAIRSALARAAGGFPVLLVCIGALGMLWADVGWHDRVGGFDGLFKLAFIPLLLVQYRRSARGWWVIYAVLAAAVALLILSWGLALLPGLAWRGKQGMPGVPVKDYISQSGVFVLCAFALLGHAVDHWRARRQWRALGLVAVATAFLANVAYVESARTTFIIVILLAPLLGFVKFGWKGVIAATLAVAMLAGALWSSSPYLRARIMNAVDEVQAYRTMHQATSSGLRLEYWKRSIDLVADAPIIGHGTGSIPSLLSSATTREAASFATVNPHSQIFVVALQLGLVGAVVLFAMWVVHLMLFRGNGAIGWMGLIVVVENIVGSLLNSHLSDFTQGWTYVFGVGVLGGMAWQQQRERHPAVDVVPVLEPRP